MLQNCHILSEFEQVKEDTNTLTQSVYDNVPSSAETEETSKSKGDVEHLQPRNEEWTLESSATLLEAPMRNKSSPKSKDKDKRRSAGGFFGAIFGQKPRDQSSQSWVWTQHQIQQKAKPA